MALNCRVAIRTKLSHSNSRQSNRVGCLGSQWHLRSGKLWRAGQANGRMCVVKMGWTRCCLSSSGPVIYKALCLATTRALSDVSAAVRNDTRSACPSCHAQLDFGGRIPSSFHLYLYYLLLNNRSRWVISPWLASLDPLAEQQWSPVQPCWAKRSTCENTYRSIATRVLQTPRKNFSKSHLRPCF